MAEQKTQEPEKTAGEQLGEVLESTIEDIIRKALPRFAPLDSRSYSQRKEQDHDYQLARRLVKAVFDDDLAIAYYGWMQAGILPKGIITECYERLAKEATRLLQGTFILYKERER